MGADEEVLCWDVKKGELLARWKDSGCNAEVTAIAQSKTDPDIYAVGSVMIIELYLGDELKSNTIAGMEMAVSESGIPD